MRAKEIKYIVLHCSAGFGNVASIQKFWKEEKKWNSPGYHVLVDLDGIPHQLLSFDKISNGVAGFNSQSINICYIGGVEAVKDKKGVKVYKGKDTRTNAQIIAMDNAIVKAVEWLRENGNDCSDVTILGHRDFSPDQNSNGMIESWERIKECPSFEVIPEYAEIQKAINGKEAKIPVRK